MTHRRILSLLLAGCLSLSLITACANSDAQDTSSPTVSVVPSIEPSDNALGEAEDFDDLDLETHTVPEEGLESQVAPSDDPDASNEPTDVVTPSTGAADPSVAPSVAPSTSPSTAPSVAPSVVPEPSVVPSTAPSTAPSVAPSTAPSTAPSVVPSVAPAPSEEPSTSPEVSPDPTPEVDETPATVTASSIWESIVSSSGEMPAFMSLTADDLSAVYGLDASTLVSFSCQVPMMSASISEFFIAEVAEGQMDTVKAAVVARQATLAGGFLYPSMMDLVEGYQLKISGNYIFFGIAENVADALVIFEGMVG